MIGALFFACFGLFFFQLYLAKGFRLNWPLILLAVGFHAFYSFGWQGVWFLSVVAIISTSVELVSLKSRFNVFGVTYKYDLGHKLFPSRMALMGVYPVEVTAAWVLLKYLSFFLVNAMGIHNLVVVALALVAFDLLIDPVAVAWGAWKWVRPGRFFGVPWQNFLGWFGVGVVTSLPFSNLTLISGFKLEMFVPVLIVWAIIVGSMGRVVLRLNFVKGLVACAPATLFFLSGLWVLSYTF